MLMRASCLRLLFATVMIPAVCFRSATAAAASAASRSQATTLAEADRETAQAYVLENAGKYEMALELRKNAARVQRKHYPEGRFYLVPNLLRAGVDAYRLGHFRSSGKAWSEAISIADALRSGMKHSYVHGGNAEFYAGRIGKALNAYYDALYGPGVTQDTVNPAFQDSGAEPYFKKALIAGSSGDLVKAEVLLQQAVGTSSDFHWAHLVLGEVAYARHDYEAAFEHWVDVLATVEPVPPGIPQWDEESLSAAAMLLRFDGKLTDPA